MQITSTRPRIQPKEIANKAQVSGTKELFKPLTEQWTVGESVYDSTSMLLAAEGDLDGVQATYTYTTDEAPAEFTPSERYKNAIGTGVFGAATGVVVGGAAGAVLGVMGVVGDVASGLMGGSMGNSSSALIMVPLVLGGVIGAATGAVQGYKAEPETLGGSVSGVLSKTQTGAAFFPGGQVGSKVDLQAFKDADLPDVQAAKVPESKPVKHALMGAGAGLVGLPAQLIPGGVFGPAIAGAKLGDILGDGRTTLGEGLGILAGVTTTTLSGFALSAATNGGSYLPLVALAGGVALGGALLGDKVMTRLNTEPAQRPYGEQWWNAN